MSDTRGSAGGTSRSEGGTVSLTFDPLLEPAVAEARAMAERLQQAVHRGLGDNRKSARAKVADATGVPESYLKRLHQKAQEMTDVSGKYARLLRIACEKLDQQTARANRRREDAEHELLEIRQSMAARRGEGSRDGRQASLFSEPQGGRQDRASATSER